MNRKKIVITGASGFLGSHLVNRFKDDERYKVYALSSKPESIRDKASERNVEFLEKDTLNAEVMFDAYVVNCAYPRNSTGTAIASGLKYIQKVFEAAVENNASSIINISSQSVYSQQRMEIATEDTQICLENPYAVGKYAVELMLESICRESKMAYTNLRMASLIGPGFDQRIINRFAIKLINREEVTVVRQKKKLGFLDIEDAVTAIDSVIDCPKEKWKSVYNIGNAQGFTVEEIYNMVLDALNDRISIPKTNFKMGTEEYSTEVSFERLKQDTGFIPSIDMKESIKRIVSQI